MILTFFPIFGVDKKFKGCNRWSRVQNLKLDSFIKSETIRIINHEQNQENCVIMKPILWECSILFQSTFVELS